MSKNLRKMRKPFRYHLRRGAQFKWPNDKVYHVVGMVDGIVVLKNFSRRKKEWIHTVQPVWLMEKHYDDGNWVYLRNRSATAKEGVCCKYCLNAEWIEEMEVVMLTESTHAGNFVTHTSAMKIRCMACMHTTYYHEWYSLNETHCTGCGEPAVDIEGNFRGGSFAKFVPGGWEYICQVCINEEDDGGLKHVVIK